MVFVRSHWQTGAANRIRLLATEMLANRTARATGVQVSGEAAI